MGKIERSSRLLKWNDEADRGLVRKRRSDLLSPSFKVAAQATAELGVWSRPRGCGSNRRLNWIYRAVAAVTVIGSCSPVAWTLCNSGFCPPLDVGRVIWYYIGGRGCWIKVAVDLTLSAQCIYKDKVENGLLTGSIITDQRRKRIF